MRPLPVTHVSQACGTGSGRNFGDQRYRQRVDSRGGLAGAYTYCVMSPMVKPWSWMCRYRRVIMRTMVSPSSWAGPRK